jgi:hypothetical protein
VPGRALRAPPTKRARPAKYPPHGGNRFHDRRWIQVQRPEGALQGIGS